jgi:hypothetical protein
MADVRNGDIRQDQTPPLVQSVSPTRYQTHLSTDATVTATFSEAMDEASVKAPGNFTLTEQGTTQPLTAEVTYDPETKKATLDPRPDLKANTTYTATVKGGDDGAKDAEGIALAQDEIWSFTTAAAPTVGSTAPQDGATGVAISTNAEATFSEAMSPDTVSSSTFTLTEQGTTQPLTAEVTYDPETKKATLDPPDLKANTIYTATVKGGTSGVKDPAGIPLAADKSWSFTTAAQIPETTGPALNFRFAIVCVALGVFAYVVTIVVLLAFTKLESAAVTAALGALLAFIGTLAGAYFGIKSTQDTTDKAKGQVEEAYKQTEEANKRTERAYRA